MYITLASFTVNFRQSFTFQLIRQNLLKAKMLELSKILVKSQNEHNKAALKI